MNKKMSLALVGVCIVFLAITAVTASPRMTSDTPLYTFRMQQASTKMNFLSTSPDTVTYTTDTVHTLNFAVTDSGGAVPLKDCTYRTCYDTCDSTCGTCAGTCVNTCPNTCVNSCNGTCSSCSSTCVNTCPNTCVSTCNSTCYTCTNTCASTCDTCYYSCEM